MTLLSISRPSISDNSRNYRDFAKGFAHAIDRYTAECKNIPSINIIEEDEQYQIHIVAPGFSKEEFAINIEKDTLTVSATAKEEKLTGKYLLNEFVKCSFERDFTLGKTVNTDQISAEHTNGILTITLAKAETAKVKPPRTISVN